MESKLDALKANMEKDLNELKVQAEEKVHAAGDEKALQDAAKSFNELKNPPAEGVESKSHSVVIVARRLDGQVSVAANKDGMSASATVTAPYGGKPITEAQVRSALSAAGVVKGIDIDAIAELLTRVAELPSGGVLTAVVAQGQLPLNGSDSRFERLVETLRERVLRPQIQDRQHDRVDLRDLGVMVTVVPGDAVMYRHPPEPGVDGFKITGEPLLAKPGVELPWTVGAGTQISKEDPNQLQATQEGLPQEIEQGMQVDEVLTIRDVDAKFGHVMFSGSIMITGKAFNFSSARTACISSAPFIPGISVSEIRRSYFLACSFLKASAPLLT